MDSGTGLCAELQIFPIVRLFFFLKKKKDETNYVVEDYLLDEMPKQYS